jgi:protein O-mannose beta-1,4-N-acetylglucosaminyltransferase
MILNGSYQPTFNEIYFATLSGLRENTAFVANLKYYSYDEEKDKSYRIASIQATNPALFLKRFIPTNPMHLLHDEILPALATILYHKRLREKVMDRLVITLDNHGPVSTDEMMTWLGQFLRLDNLQAKLRLENDLKADEFLDYICFKDAYLGLDSPSTSWYQYGFHSPQGPIQGIDRELVGGNLRAAANWLKDEIFGRGRKPKEAEVREIFENLKNQIRGKKQAIITIISRLGTRLILNEDELKDRIQEAFPTARIQIIRHERSSMEELISKIADSVVLIGMHGALISLAAFLPPGAVLIEMFPYGIPAENYTPYKTLSELPEMKIKYASWVNPMKDEPFNVGHADRDFNYGGLKGYPQSYQMGIKEHKTVPPHKCCYSPFWIYKIFQDTHVQPDVIIKLIKQMI